MTSSDQPADGLQTDAAVRAGRPVIAPEALRQLADEVHRSISTTFDGWTADVGARPAGAQPANPTFSRPVTAPPVRMEQMARTPEPTADLDDLVDLLVPRLLEKLVPALREALRDED